MSDPFGVYEVNKGLIARWQAKRDLKRRTEFSQRKGGDGKMIPTKELYGIRWKDNPTDKAKVKEMKTSLKEKGQLRAVRAHIDRKNPQLTILEDGHHRVAAQKKLRNKYTKANISVAKNIPKAIRAGAMSPMQATWKYRKVELFNTPRYIVNRASANNGGKMASKTIAELKAGKGRKTEEQLRAATREIKQGRDMRQASRNALASSSSFVRQKPKKKLP